MSGSSGLIVKVLGTVVVTAVKLGCVALLPEGPAGVGVGPEAGGSQAALVTADAGRPGLAGAEPTRQRLANIEFLEVNRAVVDGRARQLLVLVHGTPGSARAFRWYINDPLLQQRFHLIAVTRPGWVHAGAAKLPLLTDQVQALLPLLQRDESGLGAILLGHSLGGPIVAKAAMTYPELVSGLVLVASTGAPQLSGPRWYNRLAAVLPRFILGNSLAGANAEIMPLRPQLEAMVPRWAELRLPVLIIQGSKDWLVHPGNADFLREQLVNAEVTYLPREGRGHFILWQEQELIRDAVLAKFAARPE